MTKPSDFSGLEVLMRIKRQIVYVQGKGNMPDAMRRGLVSVTRRIGKVPLKFNHHLFHIHVRNLELEFEREREERKFNLIQWILGYDTNYDKGVALGLKIARDVMRSTSVRNGDFHPDGSSYKSYIGNEA